MTGYVAAMAWEPDGRLAKVAEFDTEAEAQAHVDAFAQTYPDAFVAERPERGQAHHWRVDAGTLAFDETLLPPAPGPDPDEALADAIEAAGDLSELKSALLGRLTPGQKGRASGRPT